jgi:hypothetical protein
MQRLLLKLQPINSHQKGYAMSDNTLEQVFQVTGPARIEVGNISGSVEIRPGADGTITVNATKLPHTGDESRTEIEVKQESDGTVKAVTRFPEGGWNWMFGSRPCDVDYVITAPRQCSLKVNGVSNMVKADDFEGDFTFNSVSGDLTLNGLTGPVKLKTVSGDVTGAQLAGPLHLTTVSGDVHLDESTLPLVEANTVSGDMCIHTPLAEGPYTFKSVSGDVTLTVAPETHCTAELHSVSGDLASAFPITAGSRNHGNQTIDIQGGGVKVFLHSVSGDLALECDGEVPAALEPAKVISSEDRKAVLERVERGELSVEEALGKLHS